MTSEQVAEALKTLIEERAERGNCQSKHGPAAAEGFELWYVMDQIDKLIGPTV
jgi:hypothetical protein